MYASLINCARCLVSYPGFFDPPGLLQDNKFPTDPECEIFKYEVSADQIAYCFTDEHTVVLSSEKFEALAVEMAQLAELWVFYHELTHIANGHVDWVSNNGGSASLSESPTAAGNPHGITRQTLEWDADLGATELLLRHVLSPDISIYNGRTKWSFAGNTDPAKLTFATFLVVCASTLAKIIIACKDTRRVDDLAGRTHPAALLRQAYALHHIVDILDFRANLDRDFTSQIAGGGFVRVWDVWKKVFPIAYDPVEAGNLFEIANDTIALYMAEWERIRPQLDKYKRLGVLRFATV